MLKYGRFVGGISTTHPLGTGRLHVTGFRRTHLALSQGEGEGKWSNAHPLIVNAQRSTRIQGDFEVGNIRVAVAIRLTTSGRARGYTYLLPNSVYVVSLIRLFYDIKIKEMVIWTAAPLSPNHHPLLNFDVIKRNKGELGPSLQPRLTTGYLPR